MSSLLDAFEINHSLGFKKKDKNRAFLIDLFINQNEKLISPTEDIDKKIYFALYYCFVKEDTSKSIEILKDIISMKNKYLFMAYDYLFYILLENDKDELKKMAKSFLQEYKDTIKFILKNKDINENNINKYLSYILNNIGAYYIRKNKLFKASKYIMMSIYLDDYAIAYYNMGYIYNKCYNNKELMVAFYLKASEKGYYEATYELGNYYKGIGLIKESNKYYKLAADKGYIG